MASQEGVPGHERLAGLRGHAAAHGTNVLLVGLATVVGAAAAFAFQLIAIRAYGDSAYGLLGAFFGIITVAAVASSALQNAVSVQVAEFTSGADTGPSPGRARLSAATILGLGGGAAVAILTPLLSAALATTPTFVLIAAATIPMAFWLADSVGVLQGVGRSVGAVWWTTASMLARVVLLVATLALGWGISGALIAILASTVAAAIGARLVARTVRRGGDRGLSRNGVTVLLLSMAAAWLVNADVIVLPASSADPDVVGHFAAAATLVKASFMLPAILSVYLLPRFVRNRANEGLVRIGQRVTIGITLVSGAGLAVAFWLLGDPIARLAFGSDFTGTGELLLPLALAYLPWMVAQAMLIRLTAESSRPAVLVLVVGIALQAVGFAVTVPHVTAVIWMQAIVGVGVLAALSVLVRRLNRSFAPKLRSM